MTASELPSLKRVSESESPAESPPSGLCLEAARALLDMVYGLGREYNITSDEAEDGRA